MVWPALLPTFLFFGGLASAALLTQLITYRRLTLCCSEVL